MAWWGWGRGWRRGWRGPWPGNGPFSYLPPWERPGWVFGRGACWRLFGWPGFYRRYWPFRYGWGWALRYWWRPPTYDSTYDYAPPYWYW